MRRLRFLLILLVALVATPWGVGDARVRGGARRLRGQLECASDVARGGLEAAGPAAPAPVQDEQHQAPHAVVAVGTSVSLAGLRVSVVSLHFTSAAAMPGSTAAYSSRAPPALA